MTPRRFSIARTIFPARIIQWSGPLLAAAFGALGLVLIVSWSGILDLSASKPHPEGWARFLHYTFKQSTAHHADGLTVPADVNSMALIEKGAAYYDRACAHCHAAPGRGQNPVALSMRPQPQYLVGQVGDFSPAELFWIVKHGVKYSAMPSWPVPDRDDEVWAVVAFLKRLPTMSHAQYRLLVKGGAAGSGITLPSFEPGNFPQTSYVLGQTSPQDPTYKLASPAIGFDGSDSEAASVQRCVDCHGVEGAGRTSGGFPNIALLKRDAIVNALNNYASGARHSGFMQNVAVQLTPKQIDGLADYFSRQPKKQSAEINAPPALLALGQRIATAGLPAKKIGACANCHDESKAAAKAFPAIDGQFPMYLRDQLRLFRAGIRGGAGTTNAMYAEAQSLSDREIDAVASFYASRAPSAPISALAARPVADAQRSIRLSTAK